MAQCSKYLFVFDFDDTIVNGQAEYYQGEKLLSKKEHEELIYIDQNISFNDSFKYLYSRLKQNGITIDQLNKVIESVPYNDGMVELFNYLRKNKSVLDIIALSGDVDYVLKVSLKKKGILDLFSTIIAYEGIPGSDDNEYLIDVKFNEKSETCEICNPNTCKTKKLNEYLGGKKYDVVIFVCDGGNDYCYANSLQEKDYVFCRKDFGLYKRLYKRDMIKNLKCNVKVWENGFEIIDELKKIIMN